MDEAVEQTLHISRTVDVFQIPPRAPTGWRSGEWLVSNKIFSGRLRVVSSGLDCEIRIEDPDTDQLFAACPVKYGMRTICVEPVVDSSRYFVLRVEDPGTKRHAFLGMGFAERGEAFDFNDALIRHEKFVEREKASTQLASNNNQPQGATTGSSKASIQAATASKEMAVLYKSHGDLSLKDGQTIHVTVKSNKAPGAASSWFSSNGSTGLQPPPVAQTGSGLCKLAPPPADYLSGSTPVQPPMQPIASPAANITQPYATANSIDLLSMDVPPSVPQNLKPQQPSQTQPAAAGFGDHADWAVFK